jgi:hypothetical protein
MQDSTMVIVALCAGATIFMVLGGFLFFWVTRSLNRFFIVGLVRRLIGEVDSDVKNDEAIGAYIAPRQRRDLRSQVQGLDFDSAVARHRGEPVPPTQPIETPAQGLPPAEPPQVGPNTPSLRQRQRRKKDSDDNLDEVFGGMLDGDGDGDIDF